MSMQNLTKDDLVNVINILEGKIPESRLNGIMKAIADASTYYDRWDSPYNKPTFLKLAMLAFAAFGTYMFMIGPLFFNDTSSVQKQVDELENQQVSAGGTPLLSKFEGSVSYIEKEDPDGKIMRKVNIYNNGKALVGTADVTNGTGKVIFASIDKFDLKGDVKDMAFLNGVDFREEQTNDIKKIIDSTTPVSPEFVKFSNLDYGVDKIINSKE